jgi:hypothetical protein
MVADPVIFGDLAFVFVAAVVGGALAWWPVSRSSWAMSSAGS